MSNKYLDQRSDTRLGQLVVGHRGVSYQPEHLRPYSDETTVTLLRATNIQGRTLTFSDVQFVPASIVSSVQFLEYGDIAVCMSNGSKALVGKSAPYRLAKGDRHTIGSFCSVFKPVDRTNCEFVLHLFGSQAYQSGIDFALAGSAINNLKNSEIEKIQFRLPPQEAWSRIAAILTSIDTAIEKTEALIEKYQQIKAGLMHDLFTRGVLPNGQLRPPRDQAPELYQETAIGWIPKDWVFTTCARVCEKIIDCKNRTPPETPDGFPVIRTPNVRHGEFVDLELAYTDEHSYAIWTMRGKPQVGDIVITREAPVGEVCMIPSRHPSACLGQRMMLYRPNQDLIDSRYFLYALQSRQVQLRLDLISGGSTVGHVRVGDIRDLWMLMPESRLEQQQIASSLDGIRERLVTESQGLGKLRSQKLGLMQDLLTGKVPVKVGAGGTAHD